MNIQTASFVTHSDLLEGISTDARLVIADAELGVSFGDANRTLVGQAGYRGKVLDVVKDDISETDKFIIENRLNGLPAGVYIDMEN